MTESLHAPGFVNYACQLCGWCCHQYDISFSQADFDRLSKLDWGRLEPALAGKEWAAPLREFGNPDSHRLRYAADGACVFLDGNLCRMHKHVGEFGKTLGCSVYPFTFAATPSGVYTGCRFSCKAMAYGLGEPLGGGWRACRGSSRSASRPGACRYTGTWSPGTAAGRCRGRITWRWRRH